MTGTLVSISFPSTSITSAWASSTALVATVLRSRRGSGTVPARCEEALCAVQKPLLALHAAEACQERAVAWTRPDAKPVCIMESIGGHSDQQASLCT